MRGAFQPATDEATLVLSGRRDSASHIRLLERMVEVFPSEKWLVIEDNPITHKSRDVKAALLAWPEMQIQYLPKYASSLNLIESWWKQLKNLALKGRRFETVEELEAALLSALDYWNRHRRPYRWRKIPSVMPEKILGGYGSILVPKTA